MDANFNIYSDDPDKIPAEDKARMEGFLKGREEADLLKDVKAAAYDAKVREMEQAPADVHLESLGSRPKIIVDGADEETTREVAAALDALMRGGKP